MNNTELRISFTSPFSRDQVSKIKTIKGRRWYPNDRYWAVPYTEETVKYLTRVFVEGVFVESSTLTKDSNFTNETDQLGNTKETKESLPSMSDRTSELILLVRKELELRGYSDKTIKAYVGQICRYQGFLKKDLADSTNEDVRDFLHYLLRDKGKSHAYVNQTLSALKFLLTKVLYIKGASERLPRPKREHKLPDVLSQQEVLRILNSVKNIKHRAILILTYSAGLRVSEVVNLKIGDIDYSRMLIHVRQGKGKKDRYTILSGGAIEALQTYITTYHVGDWVFPGELPINHITERTVQRIFENARDKAEIRKVVSIHSLRHSFATHLLEGGTDLRYIQELLGHMSSKTTEVYTHVTEKDIRRIRSPFDWISSKEGSTGE